MRKILLLSILLVGCGRSTQLRLDDIEERLSRIEQNQEEMASDISYLSDKTKSVGLACFDALDRTANHKQEINALAREQRQQREQIGIMINLIKVMRKKK